MFPTTKLLCLLAAEGRWRLISMIRPEVGRSYPLRLNKPLLAYFRIKNFDRICIMLVHADFLFYLPHCNHVNYKKRRLWNLNATLDVLQRKANLRPKMNICHGLSSWNVSCAQQNNKDAILSFNFNCACRGVSRSIWWSVARWYMLPLSSVAYFIVFRQAGVIKFYRNLYMHRKRRLWALLRILTKCGDFLGIPLMSHSNC